MSLKKNRVNIISVLPTAQFNVNLNELKIYNKVTDIGNLALIPCIVQKSGTMNFRASMQPTFTYSKLTIETLEQGVKYVLVMSYIFHTLF